jgi:hypothetical protein
LRKKSLNKNVSSFYYFRHQLRLFSNSPFNILKLSDIH